MPTSLPTKRLRTEPSRRLTVDLWVVFLVAIGAAFFVIELVDPMPMDVEAALVAAP